MGASFRSDDWYNGTPLPSISLDITGYAEVPPGAGGGEFEISG
jgi:hypothetical protein